MHKRFHSAHDLGRHDQKDPKKKQVLVLNDRMTLDIIFQHSSLARLLKTLYHSINEGVGVTACVVNNCTRFALDPMPSLPRATQPSGKNLHPTQSSQLLNLCFVDPHYHQPTAHSPTDIINSIRRYHTMILRLDSSATKMDDLVSHLLQQQPQSLAHGHSSNIPQIKHLSTFITFLNPLKSFEQLHVEMGIQLRQCFEIAAHLVYWRVGVVIKTLSRANRYRTASTAMADDAYTAKAFALSFAPYDIKPFLIRIGMGLSLGELVDDLGRKDDGMEKNLNSYAQHKLRVDNLTKERLLQIVIFLLGSKCIEEIHTYIYLTVPHNGNSPHLGSRPHSSNSITSLLGTPPTHDKKVPETEIRHPPSLRLTQMARTRSAPVTKALAPSQSHSSKMTSFGSPPIIRALRTRTHTRSLTSLNLRSMLSKSTSSSTSTPRPKSARHVSSDARPWPLPLPTTRSSSDSILTNFADVNSPPTISLGGPTYWLDQREGFNIKRYIDRRERNYLAKHLKVKRIQKITDRPKQMQRLFLRLIPYFRGTHHIEEIIWVESLREKSLGVSRANIELLLKVFGTVLTTVEHESPVL